MITSIRQNRAMLRKKSYFKSDYKFDLTRKDHQKPLVFPKASAEFIQQISNQHRKRKKRFGLLAFAVFFLTAWLAWKITFDKHKNHVIKGAVLKSKYAVLQKKSVTDEQHLFLSRIKEADAYFSAGHFSNAVYMYKKAQLIHPNSQVVEKRLIRTYIFACERQKLFCSELE